MQATGPMKFGAAFLAGILVALGSAVVYVHSTDPHPKTTLQIAPIAVTTPNPTETLPPPTEQPEPKVEPAPSPLPAKHLNPAPVPSPIAKPRVTRRPVSLAVAKPAPVAEQKMVAQNFPPAQMPDQIPPPPIQQPNSPVEAPPPAMVPAQGPSQPQAHTVTLAPGTEIAVRLGERISTDHNYSGDTFRAVLDRPIIMDGYVIAEKGSKVLGIIVKAQKPGKMAGAAEISLALRELNTTDGQRVHIETNESLRKGPSNTSEEVAKMGGGAALGAIIGAIAGGGKGAAIGAGAGGAAGTGAVLLGHGKPAIIDTETRLSFQLSSSATITEQLN